MRIRWMPREKAALIIMRRKFGYSINTLAEAFNRSVSLIHKTLRFNHALGALNLKDLRRLPSKIKKIATRRMRRQLAFYMPQWTMFILGEADKPP
jgi:hypothetical protein